MYNQCTKGTQVACRFPSAKTQKSDTDLDVKQLVEQIILGELLSITHKLVHSRHILGAQQCLDLCSHLPSVCEHVSIESMAMLPVGSLAAAATGHM